MQQPRIVLLGWDDKALVCLERLIEKSLIPDYIIVPEGYDYKNLAILASDNDIDVEGLNKNNNIRFIASDQNLLINISWPFTIKREDYEYYKLAAISIHDSFLPKYRGENPINWALINDEKEIGITIHHIDDDIGSGDIIIQDKYHINNDIKLTDIIKKNNNIGSRLLISTIENILFNKARRMKQEDYKVTYAPKIVSEDCKIDWKKPARQLFCFIRGNSSPSLGAFCFNKENKVIIWKAQEADGYQYDVESGKVIDVQRGIPIVKTSDNRYLMILEYTGRIKNGDILT